MERSCAGVRHALRRSACASVWALQPEDILHGAPQSRRPPPRQPWTLQVSWGLAFRTVSGGGDPPGWYDDPSGRHEYRYWDGARWGDQVADAGITSVDPVRRRPSPIAGSGGNAATLTRAQRQGHTARQVDPTPSRRVSRSPSSAAVAS